MFAVQWITSSTDPQGYGWLPKNLNLGRLDLFLLLLGILMLLNVFLFIWIAMTYKYKAVKHVRTAPRPSTTFGGNIPRPSRQPIGIPTGRRAHPAEAFEPTSMTPAQYGRSVTFKPQTPIYLPPQLR